MIATAAAPVAEAAGLVAGEGAAPWLGSIVGEAITVEETTGANGDCGALGVATTVFAAMGEETNAFVAAAAADLSMLAAATALAVGGGGAFATDSNGISNFAPQ